MCFTHIVPKCSFWVTFVGLAQCVAVNVNYSSWTQQLSQSYISFLHSFQCNKICTLPTDCSKFLVLKIWQTAGSSSSSNRPIVNCFARKSTFHFISQHLFKKTVVKHITEWCKIRERVQFTESQGDPCPSVVWTCHWSRLCNTVVIYILYFKKLPYRLQ